jgi:hypothetical protein
MAGNSLNIVDMVKGYLTGGATSSISSLLGESKEKTQSGIDAAVPGLLSGLTTVASTPDGAQRLSSAVDKGDEGILSNVSSLFGKGASSDAGSGILGSILGSGGLSQLTGLIGKSSGLSSGSTGTLLSFLGPLVLGVLKKLKTSGGLDAGGLSNLLSSQRNNISAAMPESMRAGAAGGAGAEGGEAEREPAAAGQRWSPRDVKQPAAEAYSTAGPAHRRSATDWVLPLIAFAILAGLIWRWSTHTAVRAGQEPAGMAQQQKPGTEVSVDMLKDKYQSAIAAAQSQGVQITSMTRQNGKLLITGTAPSVEAVNKVWDEIKRADPSMNDVVVNLIVQSRR